MSGACTDWLVLCCYIMVCHVVLDGSLSGTGLSNCCMASNMVLGSQERMARLVDVPRTAISWTLRCISVSDSWFVLNVHQEVIALQEIGTYDGIFNIDDGK